MTKKYFVFIESNTTGTGEQLLHRAIEKGLHPIFITENPNKYSFLPIKNVEVITFALLEKDILLKHLSLLENVIGIYSSSEFYIEMAAYIAEHLGLSTTNLKTIQLCRNKYALYQKLSSFTDIHIPYTERVIHTNEIDKSLEKFSFPVIIKPNNLSGSTGVLLCDTVLNAKKHIHSLFKSNVTEVLIQEYIDGIEYSVETCCFSDKKHILGITRKYINQIPYFVELGHDYPASLSVIENTFIKDCITKLLSITDYDFGFSHIEIKIKNGLIYLIEINPRLAGGRIPSLIRYAEGIDLLEVLLDLYVDKPADIKPKYNKYSSIRHLIPKKSGNIKRISYNNQIDINEVKITKKINELFTLKGDFRDRVAYIIVSDNNAETCKTKANKAINNFDILVE